MSDCFENSLIIILMNRNSRENTAKNSVFVIGQVERVKLNCSDKFKRVILSQTSHSKNAKPDAPNNPIKVFTQGNAIVAIDDNEEAWLVSQPFEGSINLSNLVRNKITNVYLGEKELIAQTKKGNILINWGAKKLVEKNYLSKLNTFGSNDYDRYFEVFLITNSVHCDFYVYSPEKKVDNLNRLYFVNHMERQILGYPTGLRINTKKVVKGLSVGKYYTLCWDEMGKLYSWGSKSLGLGYGEIPIQDIIQTPQSVKISKNVITAFADCHYSLALTDEGVIYQWGIKREINEINEEPIFKPKPLQFKYFNCKAKFVALKGKDSNYAALSSQGQLYVWGSTARNLLNPKITLPPTWKKSYIYQPVLQTDLLNYHIYDFSIENGYLTAVAGCSEGMGNEEYWNALINKAKKQLGQFKMIRVNTESEEVNQLRRKYKNSIFNCSDSKTERKKNSYQKENFLRLATYMDVQRHSENLPQQSLAFNVQMFKKTAPAPSTTFLPFNTLKLHKRQVSENPSNFLQKKQSEKLRMSDLGLGIDKLGAIFRRGSKVNQIYNQKWHQILQKRKIQPKAAKQFNISEQDEQNEGKQNIDDYGMTKEEIQTLLKKTVQKKLVKLYIGNCIKSFLDQIKRKHSQSICNSQTHIGCLWDEMRASERVIRKIEKLKCMYFVRYILLMMYFGKYVRDFRKRRYTKSRNKALSSILAKSLMQKIKLSVFKLRKKTTKICKLNQWILFYNKQQKKCLKQLWNNFVIFTFKLKDGGEFNFTHPNPNLTFTQIFNQRQDNLPHLRLQRYMHIKSDQAEATNNIQLKTVSGEIKRRAHKFQTEKISFTLQVFPYSLHYNYFRKPKNLDINIGEGNRTNPSWVQIQKQALDEYLKQLLYEHSREYYLRKKQYDVEMGNFIAEYYQTFYEKRWKFIIEYNKIEKTMHKKKKEAELKRLLKLVNMAKLYEEDCIPEKHVVLEEAAIRKDSPIQPSPTFYFDLELFQQNYKSYVQLLHSKIRKLKKKNIR